jgi:dolichol kinase
VILATCCYAFPKHEGTTVLAVIVAFVFMSEVIRKFVPQINQLIAKLFGPVMRAHEMHKFSGIFFYLAGALLSWYLFTKPIAMLSMLYLGFGDPVASAVGIAIPGPRFRASNTKSLLGSVAAMLVCTAISIIFLTHPFILQCDPLTNPLAWPHNVLMIVSITGGVAAGLAELAMFGPIREHLDDNLLIPVVSSVVLYGITQLLDYPL